MLSWKAFRARSSQPPASVAERAPMNIPPAPLTIADTVTTATIIRNLGMSPFVAGFPRRPSAPSVSFAQRPLSGPPASLTPTLFRSRAVRRAPP